MRQDSLMKANQKRIESPRVKLLGVVVGTSAVVALGALTVAYGGDGFGTGSSLAGSGDAPANTTYVQPTVGGFGATAKQKSPASTVATSMAVPAVTAVPATKPGGAS